MIKIIPILLGVVGACALCIILTLATGQVSGDYYTIAGNSNFQLFSVASIENIKNAAWIGLPFKYEDTVFNIFTGGNLNTSLLITAIITIVPISLATIVEHIGDISAISSTVGENFIKDPGLHRSLLGDGCATALAALFGAPANTTYGENTGVLALTRVYNPSVVRMAAVLAIFFSFCPKFAALISCMPAATIGGVSLILYGMISAVGVRNIVENQVDFAKSRNVIIAAMIMSLALGISFSSAGAINFTFFGANISLSGLAVASLVGIILNAVLPGNDYKFGDNEQGDQAVNFKV
jgi:uracil permease